MKNLNSNLFALTVVTALLFLTSCSSVPEHAKRIPQETSSVTVFNTSQILEKADMEKVAELNMVEELREKLDDENADLGDLFDEFIEDPKSTGIDFREPIYMFTVTDGDRQFFCMTMALHDAEAYEDMLDMVLDDPDFEDEDEYTAIYAKYDPNLAWNEKSACVVIGLNREARERTDRMIEDLMTGDPADGLYANNDQFRDFLSNSADVSSFMSYSMLMESFDDRMMDRIYETYEEELGIKLPSQSMFDDTYYLFELNFEQGEMVLDMEYVLNEELEELYGELMDNEINTELVRMMPGEDLMMVYAFSLNMEAVGKVAEEYEMEDIIEEAAIAVGLDYDEFMSVLNGQFVFAAGGTTNTLMKKYNYYEDSSSEEEVETPIFALAVGIDNEEALSDIIDRFEGQDLDGFTITADDGLFVIEEKRGPTVYMGLAEDVLLLSNSMDLIEDAQSGEYTELAPDDFVLDIFDGSSGGMYLNLDFDTYPPSVDKLGGMGMMAMIRRSVEMFEYSTVRIEDNRTRMLVKMDEEEENSLFVLLEEIDDLAY